MAMLGRAVRSNVVVAGHLAVLPAAIVAAGHSPSAVFLYGGELWSPKARHVLRLLAQRPSTFLAISRFTASVAAAAGVPRERVDIVLPGAAASPRPADWHERLRRLGLVNGAGTVVPFFLTVARLAEPHKGHDIVIRSLPPLVARYPGVRYVIAGDGPLRRLLERVVSTSGAEHSVVFAGRVDDATKGALFAGCRALVMPSREARAAAHFEGFGIVYLEAALSGRPSIAGNTGPGPEVVIDGETGLLVDPQDRVAVLEAMMRLADDVSLANKLGERARKRAAVFTWDKTADAVDRCLRGLT
jgi:phosphatidylinositol alpha-1,6-mannosyltransferase